MKKSLLRIWTSEPGRFKAIMHPHALTAELKLIQTFNNYAGTLCKIVNPLTIKGSPFDE